MARVLLCRPPIAGVLRMASSHTHGNLKGLRVLIVEDTWQVAAGLKQLLEGQGAEVAGPVATSADAERLISQRVPDVAIVDIRLRNDDKSYGLIDRLHAGGIRTVVITGFNDVSLESGTVA